MFDAKGYESGPCDLAAPQMPWHGLVELNLSTYAWTVLTDNGSVSHTLATPAGLTSFPPDFVWEFERAGLPAVPALTVDEDAAGMELRKEILAPLAPGWDNGTYLHPVEDAGGNIWLATGIAATVNADRSGSFVLYAHPQGELEIGEDLLALKSVTTTYAAGTLPDGLDVSGGVYWKLRGIKDQGRTWLYTVSDSSSSEGILRGVVELAISGTGSYNGSTLSGLTVNMTLLKNSAACGWRNTVITDDADATETTPWPPWGTGDACDIIANVPGTVTYADYLYEYSYTQDKHYKQIRIASAFYKPDGTVLYPEFEVEQVLGINRSSSFTLHAWCVCNSQGCFGGGETYEHDCSETWTRTVTARLYLDPNYAADEVVMELVGSSSWSTDADNDGSGSGTVTASLNSAQLAEYTVSVSMNYDGCEDSMAVAPDVQMLTGPWPFIGARDGSETWVDGSQTAKTESWYVMAGGVLHAAANILRLVGAASGALTSGQGVGCPTDYISIASGHIHAYASPKGLHAGGALGPTTKGAFSCIHGAFGISTAYPRFAAYDPRQDRVALLKDNPVAYV